MRLGLGRLKGLRVLVLRILNLLLLPRRTAHVTIVISELSCFSGGLGAWTRMAAYRARMSCRLNPRHNRRLYSPPAILRKRSFVMLNSTCLTRKSVDNLLSLTHLPGSGLEWNLNRREKLRKKRSMLSGTRTEPLGTEF